MAHSTPLGEFIRRVAARKNLSMRSVAARAKARGYSLSSGALSQIQSGQIGNITIRTLDAIAAGLGVPRLMVYRAVTDDEGETNPVQTEAQIRAEALCNELPTAELEVWLAIGDLLHTLTPEQTKTHSKQSQKRPKTDGTLVRLKK
jgi:transcriptional regulator with XRE-family HTH domain